MSASHQPQHRRDEERESEGAEGSGTEDEGSTTSHASSSSGSSGGGLLSADLPRVTVAGEEAVVGEGTVALLHAGHHPHHPHHHHHHHGEGHELPPENDDLRVTLAGVEGAIGHGTVVLPDTSGGPPSTVSSSSAEEDDHHHHHADDDVEEGHASSSTQEGEDEGDEDGTMMMKKKKKTHDEEDGDGHQRTEATETRKRWCWPIRRRRRRRRRDGGEEGAQERRERWWRSVFLYFYLRSLFPTPKEFDYRWEWNPRTYALKMLALNETGKNRSVHKQNYPYPLIVILYCWFGAFVGIAVAAIITQYGFSHIDKPLLIGSFGATAVLIYGAQQSPLAQPKNVLGGHAIAALVGVTCYKAMGSEWYSCALAVSLAIAFMLLTTTPHPPAGATALIAVTGGDLVYDAGYYYVLTTLLGITIMLAVALIWNNLPRAPHMKYPRYWF